MTGTGEEIQVHNVVQAYVDACRTGDVTVLRTLFHPNAVMSGYLAGNRLVGSPDPFFEAVASAPSPASGGADYRSEISEVVVTGKLATATLREQGFLGMDFTNYFQLLEIDGEWKLVAKLFESS
jgi:hypothetical protein